jgi:hypothetical protein
MSEKILGTWAFFVICKKPSDFVPDKLLKNSKTKILDTIQIKTFVSTYFLGRLSYTLQIFITVLSGTGAIAKVLYTVDFSKIFCREQTFERISTTHIFKKGATNKDKYNAKSDYTGINLGNLFLRHNVNFTVSSA